MINYTRETTTTGGVTTTRWVEVSGDEKCRLAQLIQVLQLEQGEAPFDGELGIPSRDSYIQQLAPDLAVQNVQRYFLQFFSYLSISRNLDVPQGTLQYNVQIVLKDGTAVNQTVTTWH